MKPLYLQCSEKAHAMGCCKRCMKRFGNGKRIIKRIDNHAARARLKEELRSEADK